MFYKYTFYPSEIFSILIIIFFCVQAVPMYVTRYRFYGQSPLSVLYFCSLLRLIITLFGMQTGAQNGARRRVSAESPVSLVWLTQYRRALHLKCALNTE